VSIREGAKRWGMRAALAAAVLGPALCLIPASGLGAQQVVVVDFSREKDKVPQGWELSENEGKADLGLVSDTVGQVLRLRSESSSFAIQKAVDIDLRQTPILAWQWKVAELPKGGNFFQRSTDDQAAQLVLAFSWRRFITYIWDSTAPAGTMADAPSPPLRSIKAVVVRSGEASKGTWITETRNVREDYKQLFGDDVEKVVGVRIQINSQYTKSQAESLWKSVTFKAAP
jgi:hypothetical protein